MVEYKPFTDPLLREPHHAVPSPIKLTGVRRLVARCECACLHGWQLVILAEGPVDGCVNFACAIEPDFGQPEKGVLVVGSANYIRWGDAHIPNQPVFPAHLELAPDSAE